MEGKSSEHKRGLWTAEEDKILTDYIRVHGKGKWNRVAKLTGLNRCGKSCRLRWINYLSPSVKRGDFTEEEDDLIIRLHSLLGNRWSLIAGRVPGRTDNQVKNHWNTHLIKRLGIAKVKTKAGASSQTLSKRSAENLSARSASDFTPPPDCNAEVAGRDVSKNGSETAAGLNRVQELRTDERDNYENRFWISEDDLDFQVPNLMEFLDESLDFLWHGF